jgi:hypothetical protein
VNVPPSERSKRGFQSHELSSGGHDAMITKPTELAKILVDAI